MLAAALTFSDVGLALVLTPVSTFQTVGPTVLRQFDHPEGIAPAATLAVLAILVNLAAFALSAQDDPPLDGAVFGDPWLMVDD